MPLSKSYNLENYAAVQEFFHSHNWTDGLPVVPPSSYAVKVFLERLKIAPEHQIGVAPVRNRTITAENIAINALIQFNRSVS